MKKPVLISLAIVIVIGLYSTWNIFGPVVSSEEKFFYIPTGTGYDEVKDRLLQKKIIPNRFFFDKISKQVKYNNSIRPGKYEIRDGTSIINLVKMLRRGPISRKVRH